MLVGPVRQHAWPAHVSRSLAKMSEQQSRGRGVAVFERPRAAGGISADRSEQPGKLTSRAAIEGRGHTTCDPCDVAEYAGQTIGRALAATVNVLNPSLILIGGRLTQTGDVFLASLKEALLRHSLPFVTRELRVLPVERSESAGLIGAAHMIMDLQPPTFTCSDRYLTH